MVFFTVTTTMSTTRRPSIIYKISSVITGLAFVPVLLDVFSFEYAELVKLVYIVVKAVLEGIKFFKRLLINKFRRGSVIVDMDITFYSTKDTPKESEVQQIVDNAIQSATFTIEASTTALTVTDTTIGTFANVGTIKPLTATTTGSELTKGYNNTVTFKIVITIDEPYESILSDPESAGFQEMRNRFVTFLEPICKNVTGCREIVVNSFYEGSIVADIDVIFQKTETTPNAQMIEGYIIKAKDDGLAPFIIQSLKVTRKDQEKVGGKVEAWKIALIVGFGVMTLFMVFLSALVSIECIL